ncbi:MAG: alpha/beta fold hydrolase [Pseudomonadota bacterium]
MSKPARRESVFIDGPAGRIEALIDAADQSDAPVAVVCHPHPAHGGAMTNKVAYTLARAFQLSGYHAVRFNFRGVGDSEGSYDEGIGERSDALAVIDWARSHFGVETLAVGGFSFGSAIALAAAQQRSVSQLVLVAPPVGRILDPQIRLPDGIPTMVVQGGQDAVVDPAAVRAWLDGQNVTAEVAWMEEAGHFFHGALPDLRSLLVDRITAVREQM